MDHSVDKQSPKERIYEHLGFLYGANQVPQLTERLETILARFTSSISQPTERIISDTFSEKDIVLIMYGDQIDEPNKPSLQTLDELLMETVSDVVNTIHILPFFPYSSDEGFSVMDYRSVDPDLGNWEHIEKLGEQFRLMVDAVINHISRSSNWFQAYIAGTAPYKDYFITVDEGADLAHVVRPRTLPLLTTVPTSSGSKQVWTTFSQDQIDLNYTNPNVLFDIIEILLFYVTKGARIIRLDAIAYLWKKIGTSCIHLEHTHRIVKLFRAIFDMVAPYVLIITETNVPHRENTSYFGNGTDEAQMVYQFPLPPLIVHTFHTEDATQLSKWISQLQAPSLQTTFFNFLASHDGIGLRPVEGILEEHSVRSMVDRTLKHGGHVSYKTNQNGTKSPYELNISFFDALSSPHEDEPSKMQVNRFLASQAIMLSLAGVPGIYFHSLFGSRSWKEGPALTGSNRSINRQRLHRSQLEQELQSSQSLRHQVFSSYLDLVRIRISNSAFHPTAAQDVLMSQPGLFMVLRSNRETHQTVLAIHNVTKHQQSAEVDLANTPLHHHTLHDLISGQSLPIKDSTLCVTACPYQVLWLTGDTR